MGSGSDHSQNTPLRAEYERLITPLITFIKVQPDTRLKGAHEGSRPLTPWILTQPLLAISSQQGIEIWFHF